MVLAWFGLCEVAPCEACFRRIRKFVLGALAIEVAGVLISLLADAYPAAAASLLRLYWFRLADAMLPLGIALAAAAAFSQGRRAAGAAVVCLSISLALAAYRQQEYAIVQGFDGAPRADKPGKVLDYDDWRDACAWVAEHTPADALFLTPRTAQTFTWHAGRGQVASWKDLPQDARAIVEWWNRLEEIYGSPAPEVQGKWLESLSERNPDELRRLGAKYGAGYLLSEAEPPLALPRRYQNNSYAVYDLGDGAD
jgi:hypothetical protein